MGSRVALFLIILAVLLAGHRGTFSSQSSAEGSGVIDGDTLQVDGDVVQLYRIDAPELGQLCESNGRLWHCGMEAALALSKLVTLNQSSLRCSPWSKAGTGVPVPVPASAPQVCEVGGEDLAVLTLRTGNSLALSGAFPDYVEAEQQARDAGLGILAQRFRSAVGMARRCSVAESAKRFEPGVQRQSRDRRRRAATVFRPDRCRLSRAHHRPGAGRENALQ